MKITSIRLRNFKRFTDLLIKDIPETAKLVVIVGPNGSGKSSVFDALLQWYRNSAGFGFNSELIYFRKSADEAFEWGSTVEIQTAGQVAAKRGSLYLRTAYRHDPDFNVTNVGRLQPPSDEVRGRVIEGDATVSTNYQRLLYETMAAVYSDKNNAKTVETLREELIGQIRASMREVFGDLLLNNISDPLGEGAFYFEKGAVKSYHYKNLSGGEKAAFDLLLDVHIKKQFFLDAIYCIDELEIHLHTRIQGRLLREMARVLPEGSQMWVTTHSLGVLRAAQEMARQHPGSVAVIDFDGIDADQPSVLVPSNLGRISWEKMLSIMLDDLSPRIAPEVIVICEGSTLGNRRKDFDAEIYNHILGMHHPDVLFVSGGSSQQVAATGVSVEQALEKIIPTARIVALCDRDDKSASEVQAFEVNGNLVLPRRNLESYLFDDEVIEALAAKEGKAALLSHALKIKQDAIAACVAQGKPADDIKSAAGLIYVGLKKLFGLTRCGNDSNSFMRDTLAPLIEPHMNVYAELHVAIIKRVAP